MLQNLLRNTCVIRQENPSEALAWRASQVERPTMQGNLPDLGSQSRWNASLLPTIDFHSLPAWRRQHMIVRRHSSFPCASLCVKQHSIRPVDLSLGFEQTDHPKNGRLKNHVVTCMCVPRWSRAKSSFVRSAGCRRGTKISMVHERYEIHPMVLIRSAYPWKYMKNWQNAPSWKNGIKSFSPRSEMGCEKRMGCSKIRQNSLRAKVLGYSQPMTYLCLSERPWKQSIPFFVYIICDFFATVSDSSTKKR